MPKLTDSVSTWTERARGKERLTPHVLGADTGWQRALWCTSKLVCVKLRIKSVFVKVYVKHPCTGVYERPRHNDRLAINALAHDVECLTRAADPVLLAGVLTSVSAYRDNVLAHELPDADGSDNVPNGNRASRVDGKRVYAVAK